MDGKITISKNSRGTININITDCNSRVKFCNISITKNNFAEALFGLAKTPCSIKIKNLEHVGKIKEIKPFQFEVPNRYDTTQKQLEKMANKECPKGWEVEHYYDSQKTFEHKHDKTIVNTHIFRYKK